MQNAITNGETEGGIPEERHPDERMSYPQLAPGEKGEQHDPGYEGDAERD